MDNKCSETLHTPIDASFPLHFHPPADNTKKRIECAICMEKIKRKNKVKTRCGHSFHLTCLMQNVERGLSKQGSHCPICREHLYKRKVTMMELYEETKDHLSTFSAFCYFVNATAKHDILDYISDFKRYKAVDYNQYFFGDDDDDDEDNDDESDEDAFHSTSFYLENFERTLNSKMNDVLQKVEKVEKVEPTVPP